MAPCRLLSHSRVAVTPIAMALAGLVALGCSADAGDDGDVRADQARDAAAAAELPDEVTDVLALAAEGTTATYRATYAVPAGEGRPAQLLVISQRPPDRRIDVESGEGAELTIDATIGVGGLTYQCLQASAAWSCFELDGVGGDDTGGFSAEALADFGFALADAAATYDLEVETRPIAGVTATCLVTTRRADAPVDATLGERGTLCLSREGVVLLAETPTGAQAANTYSTEVPDATFELPAPASPVGPGGGVGVPEEPTPAPPTTTP